MDILGLGFLPHQDDLFAGAAEQLRLVGIEHARRRWRRPARPAGPAQAACRVRRVEAGMQQLFEHFRVRRAAGPAPVDQPLLEHFHRGPHQGGRIHLAVAGLQAVQNAVFDGVFDSPAPPGNGSPGGCAVRRVAGTGPASRRSISCTGFGVRMPATTSSPWALTRYSPYITFSPVPGLRVKPTPVARVVAHVAEHHRADVDGRAVGHVRGDVEFTPVVDGALAQPGVEHRLDRDLQLFVDVCWGRVCRYSGAPPAGRRSLISRRWSAVSRCRP